MEGDDWQMEVKQDMMPMAEDEREETAKRVRKKKIMDLFREIFIDLVIILLCVIVVPRYVVQRTIVSGKSMQNTLQEDDNLLVEKVSYLIGEPDRFDVVVFYPYGKNVNEYFVKRIIGLPGETIQIIGDEIYIDGELLEEGYGKDPIIYQGIAGEPLTLGDDEYFVMGDNRKISFDSRYEEVGPIHRKDMVGRAILRIWPFSSFGLFE